MTSPEGSAREAAERNAAAIMSGNLAQLMADITPEALTQVMQLGAQAGASGLSLTQMPQMTGYTIEERGVEGDAHLFEVTFHSSAGSATLLTRWAPVLGQWKITGVSVVSAQPSPPGETPP